MLHCSRRYRESPDCDVCTRAQSSTRDRHRSEILPVSVYVVRKRIVRAGLSARRVACGVNAAAREVGTLVIMGSDQAPGGNLARKACEVIVVVVDGVEDIETS